MKTVSYRFAFLDSAGAAVLNEAYSFADDVSALESAIDRSASHAIEIWDGGRRVAAVKKGHAPLNEFDRESL